VVLRFSGVPAVEMRDAFRHMGARDRRAWAGKQLLFRFPGASCDSVRIEGLEPSERPLRISARFDGADLLQAQAGGMAFQPGSLGLHDWNFPFPETGRRHPLAMPYPVTLVDSVALGVEGLRLAEGAEGSDSLETEFGAYRWRLSSDSSGTVRYVRFVRMDSVRVAPAAYPAWRGFVNRVAQSDRTVFPLGPGP
jgi:hypothetical protein